MYIPTGADCVPCTRAWNEGFAYFNREQLISKLAANDATVTEGFNEARSSDGSESFGRQGVEQEKEFKSKEYINLDGWLSGQFKRRHGVDPEACGFRAVSRIHPLTLAPVDVFYTPAEGPLFQLQL